MINQIKVKCSLCPTIIVRTQKQTYNVCYQCKQKKARERNERYKLKKLLPADNKV